MRTELLTEKGTLYAEATYDVGVVFFESDLMPVGVEEERDCREDDNGLYLQIH